MKSRTSRFLRPRRQAAVGTSGRTPHITPSRECEEGKQTVSLFHYLPTDIFIEIAECILSQADLFNLLLTSASVYDTLLHLLYTSVNLKSYKQCMTTLNFLTRRADIAARIHKLVLRPYGSSSVYNSREELAVSSLMQSITGNFPNMIAFTWDGLEMPNDGLWRELRLNSPRLRIISTNVGAAKLDPECQLFEFSNLIGFSMTVKPWTRINTIDGATVLEQLPPRLWNMLLERCPQLCALFLDGPSWTSRPFDLCHIMDGDWPRLRRLVLGQTFSHPPVPTHHAHCLKLSSFLSKHSKLQSLGMRGGIPEGTVLPKLPQITVFSGLLRDIESLRKFPTLTSLKLMGQNLSDALVLSIANVLETLPLLSKLSIRCYLWARTGHRMMFRTLLSSCRQLSNLELSCASKYSFDIRDFVDVLPCAPQLKSFVLVKKCGCREEPMQQTALRIAQENPSLSFFRLDYARSWRNYRRDPTLKQKGSYSLERNAEGCPIRLRAAEWQHRYFMRPATRQFTRELCSPH